MAVGESNPNPKQEDKGQEASDSEKLCLEVYRDVLQPGARELGTELAPVGKELGTTAARAIHVALAPLRALVWSYEQIETAILPSLQQKLANRLDKLVTPSLMIAGPALEALRFAASNEQIREMYVNLLATSMDEDTVQLAHPSFVEFLRQMTPDEVRVLQVFNFQRLIPLLTFMVIPHYLQPDLEGEGKGMVTVYDNFSFLGEEASCEFPDLVPVYLDNLVRLGLLEIPPLMTVAESSSTSYDSYNKLFTSPRFAELSERIETNWKQTPQTAKKCVRITSLGKMFRHACEYSGS